MQVKEMLYEGKAKKVFATDDPRFIWFNIKTVPLLLMVKRKVLLKVKV